MSDWERQMPLTKKKPKKVACVVCVFQNLGDQGRAMEYRLGFIQAKFEQIRRQQENMFSSQT